ncbi:penicillin-binding protein 2 [Leucobacter sp. OH1287]|uniref:peptidoglycan D,D-transpeptidase FtsI family protein n=1 Tax=Leucobacter sp. OH1287 TaxID=2491049 RepID=UPI000F5E01EE|nr:penicillin-binding protein 2 [Leucobacter sp. OH1287]RRD60330.1 penicillin-binding protein 2 [Leucobacter sp. OH1287]
MNKPLKNLTRTVLLMFVALFVALTAVQVVQADELRANPLNERTTRNAFKVERGTILVGGEPIATAVPTDDLYQFRREYANGPLYAPVTGYFSNYQGATGIEQALNSELSGLHNSQFFDRISRILTGQDPQGSSVELTLDPVAQQAAYEALGEMRGAVVVMDYETGKILALVSTPSYDPNLLSGNDNNTIITNYQALEEDPGKPLVNRAIAGDTYHPGSTYKLLTAAAAIESGKATASSTFDDKAELTLPGSSSVMRNASQGVCENGDKVSLETALIRSCNIPFAELAISMEAGAVSDLAKSFGFDESFTIPMRVTASASPTPNGDAQKALSAIGQLDVRATPLQMAIVSATIANGGKMVEPTLVDRVISPDLRTEQESEITVLGNPISESTASVLGDMMRKTVSDANGTAKLAAIDGVAVAGKTGTAENGTAANGQPNPYTLWFTGFAEKDDKKLAIAVVVEDGGGVTHNYQGSSYDIPTNISKRVMEAVFNQ